MNMNFETALLYEYNCLGTDRIRIKFLDQKRANILLSYQDEVANLIF